MTVVQDPDIESRPLQFSADLKLSQSDIARIIASYMRQQGARPGVKDEDVSFSVCAASDDRYHYTPASTSATVKIRL